MVAQLIESSPVEPLVVGVHLFPGDTWFREVRVVSTTSQQPVDLSAWVFEAKLGDGVGTVDASRAADGILSVTFAPSVTASAKRGTQLTIAGALAGGRRTFVVGRVGAEVGSSIPVGLVQRKRVVQTDVDISVYAAPRGDKGADGTAISRALVEQVETDRKAAGTSAFNAGASAAAAQSSEEEAQRAEGVAVASAEQARVYAAGTVALQDAAVAGLVEGETAARQALLGTIVDVGSAQGWGAGGSGGEVALAKLHPGSPLARAASGPVRVIAVGDSIEDSSAGWLKRLDQALKAQYGDSGAKFENCGMLGGSWTNPYNGWTKVLTAIPPFVMIKGTSSSSPLVFNVDGDRYWFTTNEYPDGGSVDVLVDGVLVQTISCNGPRNLLVEHEIPLGARGNHTVTINPPVSGNAYIIHHGAYWSGRTGIDFLDFSVGGSSLYYLRATREALTTPNQAVDALFGMPADLWISGWTMNDRGTTSANIIETKAAVDRMVELTATLGKPLVQIIDMLGHYADPADPSHANAKVVDAHIRAKATSYNVTIVDWDKATLINDLAAYRALYYADGSADFTHPDVNKPGVGVAATLTCQALGIPVPGVASVDLLRSRRRRTLQLGEGQDKAAVVAGAATRFAAPSGVGLQLTAANLGMTRRVPYYRHSAAYTSTGVVASVMTDIESTPTGTDAWGPYRDYVNKTLSMGTFLGADIARLSVLVSGSVSLRAQNGLRIYVDGVLVPYTDVANSRTNLVMSSIVEPLLLTVEVGAPGGVNNSYINFNGRMYDIGLAKSTVPLLQLR